ncbi:hypothetical protein ACIQMR_36985 [Streptomyces sp. NPDC091376]|uniref:hypothetical protein n=1 Tax=Streptomyces sp. NPDC091376 TaxID=3365994 RepID=UPI0037F73A2B
METSQNPPMPPELIDNWREFYTQANYAHLEQFRNQPSALVDYYLAHFLQYCHYNFKKPETLPDPENVAPDAMFALIEQHEFQGYGLKDIFEGYLSAFGELLTETARTPQSREALQATLIETENTTESAPVTTVEPEPSHHLDSGSTNIPESLQTLAWGGNFFTERRMLDYQELDFKGFKVRVQDWEKPTERYHFLAYCHYRLKDSLGVGRREFMTRLTRSQAFTANEEQNPFEAFREAIRDGRIENYWESYRASFVEIVKKFTRDTESQVEISGPSEHPSITPEQLPLLHEMIEKHKAGDNLASYKDKLMRLQNMTIPNPEMAIKKLMEESKKEYLFGDLESKVSNPLLNDPNRSAWNITREQRDHFLLFCSTRFKGENIAGLLDKEDAALLEAERKTVTDSFNVYIKAIGDTRDKAYGTPKIVQELSKWYARSEFGDLASILEKPKDYENVLKVMDFFKEKNLTNSEMIFLTPKLVSAENSPS